MDRVGFREALYQVCQVEGVLVCYNLARLTRSIRDMIEIVDTIERHDADLALVTDNVYTKSPSGRAFLRIMAVLCEWQREVQAEHTSDVMLRMQEDGRRVSGQPPMGFRLCAADPTRIEPNPEEQGSINLAKAMRQKGASYRAIATELERRGCKPRGKRWHRASVRSLLGLRKRRRKR
jgi:site-specific DNA recombinase